VADKETTVVDLQDQPIWVQDLVAWLQKIEGQKLNGQQWIERVQEVLAELPGHGLPQEVWKVQEQEKSEAKASEQKANWQRPLIINDEERDRINQKLEDARANLDKSIHQCLKLAFITRSLPFPECQVIFQEAVVCARAIQDARGRSSMLSSLATFNDFDFSERLFVLQEYLEAAREIEDEDD
jgi:hypothetical protein